MELLFLRDERSPLHRRLVRRRSSERVGSGVVRHLQRRSHARRARRDHCQQTRPTHGHTVHKTRARDELGRVESQQMVHSKRM